MFELTDELGKEHCKALDDIAAVATVARDSGNRPLGALCFLQGHGVTMSEVREFAQAQAKAHFHASAPEQSNHVFMTKAVHGHLLALGLIERFRGWGYEQDHEEYEKVTVASGMRVSARGDVLRGRFLFKVLSRFSARANRRICVVVLLLTISLAMHDLVRLLIGSG